MAFTSQLLASVQVAAIKGDILAPSTNKLQIHSILIHNTNTTTENVILYYHDGTNERIIYSINIVQNETVHFEYIGEGLVLDSANTEKITGITDTASKVNILFFGSEVS